MADGETERDLPTRSVGAPYHWPVEPIDYALRSSGGFRVGGPDPVEPVPLEVGRRLLLAQYEFSEWVLRRVEKVRFTQERSVNRQISVEFRVPDYAPVIVDEDGTPVSWLVPLTVLRRRTVTNLDIRDEEDRSISLFGLRLTQSLDEAMLRAAAAPIDGAAPGAPSPQVIRDLVFGEREAVEAAVGKADDRLPGDRPPAELVYAATFRHLRHNFSLYVALPVAQGRHRILRMAFDDRTTWRYQYPLVDGDDVVRYRPFDRRVRSPLNVLGLRLTRIRFLTPSAERAASYHFEFFSPDGLQVREATLIADRPNTVAGDGSSPKPVQADNAAGGMSVGLHAVDVPAHSLCRVQLELYIASRGWLSTLLASCFAAATVLWFTFMQTRHGGEDQWKSDQVTNLVLFLVTISAGTATYVAAAHQNAVTGRMLTGLRMAGVIAMSLPAVVAGWMAYLGEGVHNGFSSPLEDAFQGVTFAGATCASAIMLLVGSAYSRARFFEWQEGRRKTRRSPWDQSGLVDRTEKKPYNRSAGFRDLVKDMRFDDRAIGVESSEGWHDTYEWNDELQAKTVAFLGGELREYLARR
jgi:hypothetical protein